jgi:hypothetical protein
MRVSGQLAVLSVFWAFGSAFMWTMFRPFSLFFMFAVVITLMCCLITYLEGK